MLLLLYFAVGLTSLTNVSADSYQRNYEDDMDPVIDMLLNADYDGLLDTDDNEIGELNINDELVYADGTWRCGSCANISEATLLYTEKYDLNSNYDLYTEEGNTELQIGLSLPDMRCVVVRTDEDSDVHRVSGACAGGAVTLSVVNALNCEVSVYS